MGDANIDDLRDQIDSLDAELLKLLADRAELSARIARAKRERNLPSRDPQREQAMLERARTSPPAPFTPEAARDALAALIESTRATAVLRGSSARARNIAIVGLGLMGGSLAKACKAANPGHKLTGVDVAARLEAPRASGLFASVHEESDGKSAVQHADVVFLCAAPLINVGLLASVRRDVGPDCVVTDLGGLKTEICHEADKHFALEHGPWFVGGHPMAGLATSGFANARAELFVDRPWVLTPRPKQSLGPLKSLQELIESLGARLALLTAEDHDRTVVPTSHLPQLLSVALTLCVGGRDRGLAGPALKAMTRLADSPPELWTELLHARNSQVTTELQRFRSYLSDLEMAVAFREPLKRWFDKAAAQRAALDVAPRDNPA